jgi:hypothetical protein
LQLDELARQLVGFAAGGAVADGDQLHAVRVTRRPRVCRLPSQSRRGSCG